MTIKKLQRAILSRLTSLEDAAPMEISKDFKQEFQKHFKPLAEIFVRYGKDRLGFERMTSSEQLEFLFSHDLRNEPVWKDLANKYMRDCAMFSRLTIQEKVKVFAPTFKPLR